jgi:hypothetical protein
VLRIVRHGSPEYAGEDDPPPCPSVRVNGETVAEGAIPYEVLKAELLEAGAGPQGAP